MTSEQKKAWLPILLIAGALTVWGTVLGVGAYLAPTGIMPGADYRKFLVLASTTGGFLLFWGLVMIPRAIRLRRQGRSKVGRSKGEPVPSSQDNSQGQ